MEYVNGVGLAFDYEATEGSIATASFVLDGLEIRVMADLRQHGQTLRLAGVHVDAVGRSLTRSDMRRIAEAVMEVFGYDGVVVEGAVRTTGRGAGRRPKPLRFARRGGA
ncbi:hypothetical protein [Paracoccus sanguinis]|uniref:hypothetical protein n=1 Tax=Paracoccus sanguinis TaxID=1545044 RepID=UPI00068C09AE|nr:hypothetical protein [Paracoccus sanguinis]